MAQIFIWLFLVTPIVSQIDFSEIKNFAQIVRPFLEKNYPEKKAFFRRYEKEKLIYALAYRLAKDSLQEKDYPTAFSYFTRSAFLSPLNTQIKNSEQAVLFFRQHPQKEKSPFYPEALLALAELSLDEKNIVAALWFLEEAKGLIKEDGPLYKTYIQQYGRYLSQVNPSGAATYYYTQGKKYQDPKFILSAANLWLSEQELEKSRQAYGEVLSFPANDLTYVQATIKLQNLVTEDALYPYEKLRLAEGFRILKDFNKAEKFYIQLDKKDLGRDYQYFYYQNYSRLLIDQKRFAEAFSLLKTAIDELSFFEKKKLWIDASERLYKSDRYEEIVNLLPEKTPAQEAALNRLRALYKLNHKDRFSEALYYLSVFDRDSYTAGKVAFSYCLDFILSEQTAEAKSCLQDLVSATQNSQMGGQSRFHLGKLLLLEGKIEEAKRLFRSVYLNSPEDPYLERAFLAGRNDKIEPVPKNTSPQILREWLAANAGHSEALKEFFLRKKKDPTFAVDPAWQELEQELHILPKTLNFNDKKGALIYLVGLRQEAMGYLANRKKNLLLFYLAELLNDTGTKMYYLKQYAREKKIVLDIFFMSDRALRTFYPIPWLKEVQEAAHRFSLEPESLYALMKQESMFNPKATSPANARGLMQLLPSTAKILNRSLKLPQLDLYNPRHSILLGAKFYYDLSRNYSTTFEKIAAAYNAGPGRLMEWMKTFSTDLDYFVEQIPIHQTHHYVKATRAEYDRYRWLFRYYYGLSQG